MRVLFLGLFLAFFRLHNMAAASAPAVAYSDDESVEFEQTTSREVALLHGTASRGRGLAETVLRAHDGAPLKLKCAMKRAGARTAYTPQGGASVAEVQGDGCCAYWATQASLQMCMGITRAPRSPDEIKSALRASMIAHILGSASPAGMDTDVTAHLSKDQIAKAVALELQELREFPSRRTVAVTQRKDMTLGWLQQRVADKITQEWFHVDWFAFIAEIYKVNIAVWEPTGEGQQVQLYSAGHTRGLFIFDKKDKIDEAGDFWIHILHRSQGSWDARHSVRSTAAGRQTLAFFNHFDWLQLGGEADTMFTSIIAGGPQEQLEPSSEKPGDRKRKAGADTDDEEVEEQSEKQRGLRGSRVDRKKGKKKSTLTPFDGRFKGFGKRGKKRKETEGRGGQRKKMDVGANQKNTGGRPGSKYKDLKDQANYDSDGESIGGGDTDWLDPNITGSFPALTKSEQLLKRNVKKIPEPGYREAYIRTSRRKANGDKLLKMKRKRDEEAKKNPGKQREVEKEDEEDGAEWSEDVQWTERGMEDYERSEAFKRRNKKAGKGRSCTISEKARDRLPTLDTFVQNQPASGKFPLKAVLETCFELSFPAEATKLFVEKTNGYVELCTTEPAAGAEDPRKEHQKKKSRTLGHITLPDPKSGEGQPFEEKHIHGMIGICITMGLTKKSKMRKHWSTSEFDNYPLVRACMQRDFFELLYCRFLHCSDGNAPPRLLPNGEDNPDYDSKWHIRQLEEILNHAWADNVDINQWLCYDEQMIKTVSRFAAGLMRFNPLKPITHGIKVWALCDVTGYCLISSVDGGMRGDPKLRHYFDCPLGRTTRQVLWVLLEACGTLREKLVGSGVYIAMDNFCTSPTLYECLASHDIFCVGTCRSDRTAGGLPYMQSLGCTLPERGDMNFCRSGEMAFVQWKDSKDVILCSTIHIAQPAASLDEEAAGGINHFKPYPLELRASGRKGKTVKLQQPIMRMDYVKFMGGVDSADQQNGSLAHDHKSVTNHWRRVFDAKIEQALTNAFLLFRKWVQLLLQEVDIRLAECSVEDIEIFEKAKKELTRLSKLERCDWSQDMAEMLMGRCQIGNVGKGGRRLGKKTAVSSWGSIRLETARQCMNPQCKARSTKGCACDKYCTKGMDYGVLMCQKCNKDDRKHALAAWTYWDGDDDTRARKEFDWIEV